MRSDDISLSPTKARTFLSGLLVLLLMLVWQAAPGLRQSRLSGLTERGVSVRLLPPTDSLKPLQVWLSSKVADDRSSAEPPLIGLSPLAMARFVGRLVAADRPNVAKTTLALRYSPLQARAPPLAASA